jgi:hypothetical protein
MPYKYFVTLRSTKALYITQATLFKNLAYLNDFDQSLR